MTRSAMTWSALVVPRLLRAGRRIVSVPPDLKALYDQKEYQKVLDGLSRLSQDAQALPDVRRLKVRTLVKLGNPQRRWRNTTSLRPDCDRTIVPLLRGRSLGLFCAGEGYARANAWCRLYGTEGNRLRRGGAVFRRWTE